MELDEALEHAASGNSVLFLGAGFSSGAINVKDKAFKTGKALAEFLSSRSELPGETPLEDAAEIFVDKFGVDDLISELRREFKAKEVANTHKIVAALPWKRTYTTNYDNVFEMASSLQGKAVQPIGPDTKVHLTAKSDPLCVHLNGYIDELNRDTIWNSFKLTDTSYSSASIESSEWAMLLRQDIRFARAVFFVGYSLFDLDMKRILKSSPELREKTFFIFHDAVDRVTETRGSRFGQVLKIGLQGLSDRISSGDFMSARESATLDIGRSIVEYRLPDHAKRPRDREFLNLIMLGEFNPAFSMPDSATPSLYTCDRPVVEDVSHMLDTGSIQLAALFGEIANGRTVALELIAKSAISRGWRIFSAVELSEHAERELRSIAELPGKTLLLVDDYADWLRVLSGMTSVASDRFAVVATARTNTHDLAVDDLEEVLAPLKMKEWSLNTLTEDEILWWVDTLDTYGLWGERAGDSRENKARVLSDDCGRQIQGILLELFKSPQIQGRLSDAAFAIKQHPLAEKIAITIFALTILNQRLTTDMVTDMWGVDAFERDSVQGNSGIANFVDISRSAIRVRSTTASRYLLNNFWQADEVVSVIIEMAKTANRMARISMKYRALFSSLLRFSSLQQILPDQGKRDAVITFYENMKLFDYCKRNPQFWLQYAIGALVIDDLERSDKYFETAYALADKRDSYDTYKIDNHYARLLLVRASTDAPFADALQYFRRARTLINRQIKNEKMHYPYRVAASYQDFYDRFRSKFSEAELQETVEAANTVLDRIQHLPEERSRNRYVRQCREAMEYIVESGSTDESVK